MIEEDCERVESVYEKYKYLLYKEAFAILKDTKKAEDIVQETMIKIIENIHKLKKFTDKELKNYLCAIARNLAINMSKKIKKEQMIDIEEFIYQEKEEKDNYSEIVIHNENILALREAIYQLKNKERDVLILEKMYGYSIEEVASILNISIHVARKRSREARDNLLQELGRSENTNARKG